MMPGQAEGAHRELEGHAGRELRGVGARAAASPARSPASRTSRSRDRPPRSRGACDFDDAATGARAHHLVDLDRRQVRVARPSTRAGWGRARGRGSARGPLRRRLHVGTGSSAQRKQRSSTMPDGRSARRHWRLLGVVVTRLISSRPRSVRTTTTAPSGAVASTRRAARLTERRKERRKNRWHANDSSPDTWSMAWTMERRRHALCVVTAP